MAFVLEDLQSRTRRHGTIGVPSWNVIPGARKPIGQPIGRNFNPARSEPIHGIRLIACTRHQACKGQLHALGRVALENERIEGIEGKKILVESARGAHMREDPALWAFGST
jgi:hypothetical protein